ncbi:MAG: hypothetical protein IPK26_14455 [Planctomycetes bacterium]|nr:hypothetical protein [Planctomycetota bacterium]
MHSHPNPGSSAARFVTVVAALPFAAVAQAVWTEITPAAGNPPPRYHHAMAFDRLRGVAVMFGGYRSGNTIVNETWEWNGTSWAQRAPATAPPTSYGSLLVFDRQRQHCLLFGGYTGAIYSNDTWTWNGMQWTQLLPANAPSGRYFPGVVYDPATGATLLFGGYDGTAHINDTWQWNGTTWTQLVANGAPGQPPGRRGPGIAWDEHRSVAVMFGGLVQFGSAAYGLSDTWEWSGQWLQRTPATVPPTRGHCGMDFDAFRGVTVMRGGDSQISVYRTDTWEWNGTDWRQRQGGPVPNISTGQGLVYDPTARRMLMHGGVEGPTVLTNRTWELATSQPAAFHLHGAGCGPSWIPGLAVAEADLPWVGDSGVVQVGNVPAGLLVFLAIGFDNVTSPLGPLPASLAPLGAPGCHLLVDPMASTFLGAAPVQWSTGVIPAIVAGFPVHVQAAVLAPGANALGLALSPGGELVSGVR